MTLPVLTYRDLSPVGAVRIDLARIVTSKLLIQANSGGGKSWALRQLIEETYGRIPQIILDPEGEFYTLREHGDYVLAAKAGGDVEASVKTAKTLCRRLVELRASAVIDLYELKLDERREFIKVFLTEMINLPRTLWHSTLVVLDEAQTFAPERGHGEAESTEAVIEFATKSRKRGYGFVCATQRLGKFHKDVAAELNTKLIGRTGLDIDVKRAGDDLGFGKEERAQLQRLAPGTFFVYGPALMDGMVVQARSGGVSTTHPEPGHLAAVAPPPSNKVKALIASALADLPKEAAEEAKTIEHLQRLTKQLQHDLRKAQREVVPGPERVVVDQAAIERAVTHALVGQGHATARRNAEALKTVLGVVRHLESVGALLSEKVAPGLSIVLSALNYPMPDAAELQRDRPPAGAARAPERVDERKLATEPSEGVSRPQQRMLDALAKLEAAGLEELTWGQLAVFSGQSPKSSGYGKNVSTLRNRGLIASRPDRKFALSGEGRAMAQPADVPATLADLHDAWRQYVSAPQQRMLTALLSAYPGPVEYDELAALSGQSPTSSGYGKNVSAMSALGLLRKARGASSIMASELLFPPGL